MNSPQTFTILLFGGLKDAAKSETLALEINVESVCVRDILSACEIACPALAKWIPYLRVAVDCEYAEPETVVAPHQEIALLPPVSGG